MTAFDREAQLIDDVRRLRDMLISGAKIGEMNKWQRHHVAYELQVTLEKILTWKLEAIASGLEEFASEL